MTLTVACLPFHRCGCVSIVIGLDLLRYPGGQETAVGLQKTGAKCKYRKSVALRLLFVEPWGSLTL